MSNEGFMYDADYFLRGKETNKSLYTDYHWLPDLTIPMVCSIISYLGIKYGETILDFGCARGYIVRAFRELGYEAWGHDISAWAIANADENVKEYITTGESALFSSNIDWVIAKDVLEHVPRVSAVITTLLKAARVGVFAVVPLSMFDGLPYVVADYEKDVTHIHRLCLSSWARLFMRPGWSVTACYAVPGVKQNYAQYEWGNGFIVCGRV